MARLLLLGTLLVLLAATAASGAASEVPALLRGADKQNVDVKVRGGGGHVDYPGGQANWGNGGKDVDVNVRSGSGTVNYPGGQANWGKQVDVNVGGGGSGGGSVTAPGGVQVNWGNGAGPDPKQTPPPPSDPAAAPAAPPAPPTPSAPPAGPEAPPVAPPAPPTAPSTDGSAGGGSMAAPGVNVTWGNGGSNVTQAPAAGTSTGGSVVAPGVNVTWGDGGADDVTKYPPPRPAGTEAKGNTTVTLDALGVRDTDGNCYWTWKDFVGSVYFRSIATFKDHDSETVTLRVRGRTGSCNDPSTPTYVGSCQVEIEFGQGGYMRTAQTRFSDMKHDGGLSAYNFEYVTAFTGMHSYDPGYDCGRASITVYDDYCY